MSIVLIRHGETDWSRSGRHTGWTDLPLTDAGRARATTLAQQLAGRSFAVVLCSPLRRARETCELAGFGDVAIISDDLHEWDYGSYEGLTTPQIRERDPDWNLWRDGCPEGESPSQVAERAERVIGRALSDAGEGDALLFAHGHILRMLGASWIGWAPDGGAHLALSAGALSELGFERAARVIARWNA